MSDLQLAWSSRWYDIPIRRKFQYVVGTVTVLLLVAMGVLAVAERHERLSAGEVKSVQNRFADLHLTVDALNDLHIALIEQSFLVLPAEAGGGRTVQDAALRLDAAVERLTQESPALAQSLRVRKQGLMEVAIGAWAAVAVRDHDAVLGFVEAMHGHAAAARRLVEAETAVVAGVAADRERAAYKASELALLAAIAAATVAAAGGLLPLVMLPRSVFRPISDMAAALDRLTEGDVNVAVSGTERRDEIGAIARAIQAFKNSRIRAWRLAQESERAQAALRESEQRFRDYAQSSADWFWEMGPDLRFSFLSGNIGEITGTSESYFIGMRLEEIFSPCNDESVCKRHLADLAARRPFRDFIYKAALAGGTVRWFRISGRPLHDPAGGFLGYRGSGSDVTDRIRAVEALRAAKIEAETASHAKSRFIANMSHELRTPLNAIIGFAEIIESEVIGPVGEIRYREFASDIKSSGERLFHMINDVLDLARIEAGDAVVNEEPVDLPALVTRCLQRYGARPEKDVRLSVDVVDGLPPLCADARKLKQVLDNLIDNAVKFTPTGGSVAVTVRVVPEKGVLICVADTGIGIEAEDIARVQAPFVQADARMERAYEGMGLGLPLSKMLVELHGGSLAIDSRPGIGTAVTVTLPASRLAA